MFSVSLEEYQLHILVFETVTFYPDDFFMWIQPSIRSTRYKTEVLTIYRKYEMLFQKGFQLIVLFVHWLDKNKTQIETQHQSKKGCCKNETCLLRAIMATSTIALPQGRTKWSNCRQTQAFCRSSYSSQTCKLKAEFVYMTFGQSRQKTCKQTQLLGCKFD